MKHLLSILFVSLLLAPLALAQDDMLEYGMVVSGEVTNQNFEIEYSFTGTAGDIILIAMEQTDDAGLDRPEIILLDVEYRILASQDGYASTELAAVLPADGTYTVIATRDEGRSGTSVGGYHLGLFKPPLLSDSAIESQITNEAPQFYAIETREAFVLNYSKESGDFYPTLTIFSIADDGELEGVLELNSEYLRNATLAINATGPYLVVLKRPLYSYTRNLLTANYTIVLE